MRRRERERPDGGGGQMGMSFVKDDERANGELKEDLLGLDVDGFDMWDDSDREKE